MVSHESSDATRVRRFRRKKRASARVVFFSRRARVLRAEISDGPAQVRVQRRVRVDGAQNPAPRRAQRVQRTSQVALRGVRGGSGRRVYARGALHLGEARLRLRGGGGDARERLLGARGGERGDAVSEALEHGVRGK
jgi:hypothetical protein